MEEAVEHEMLSPHSGDNSSSMLGAERLLSAFVASASASGSTSAATSTTSISSALFLFLSAGGPWAHAAACSGLVGLSGKE